MPGPLRRFAVPVSGDPLSLEQGPESCRSLHAFQEAVLSAVDTPEDADGWSDADFAVSLKATETALQKADPVAALEVLTEDRFSSLYSLIKWVSLCLVSRFCLSFWLSGAI